MHSVRRVLLVVGSIAALTAIAAPAAAQAPTITEVVGGLDSPRGVAIGADGTIYVAEAGEGGTEPCVEHPELGRICFGPTGGISAVVDGVATRLVDGLASTVTATGETIGPSDVTVDADGAVWFLIGGPGAGAADGRAGVPDGAAAGMGQLYQVDANGDAQSVADLAAYETANNPDADQPGNAEPDSNVNSVTATPEGAAVADAGANSLLLVDGDGGISVVAVFPVAMMPMPADPSASPDPAASPAMVPMDPTPTSVAVGPDGAYYVGQLTGFPFPPGGASVFRVAPGEAPTVYASGFTNIMDVAFGPDGTLYVLEIAHNGLLSADPTAGPPQGGLWKVPAGGGTPELIVSEGLVMPGGMAVAEDGTLYVSTCAVCANGGSLVSLQP
jgi:sugar lactone lactonase YvrE